MCMCWTLCFYFVIFLSVSPASGLSAIVAGPRAGRPGGPGISVAVTGQTAWYAAEEQHQAAGRSHHWISACFHP